MKYTTAGEHTKPGLPSLTGDSFKEIGSLDPSLETDATDIDKKSLNDIAFAVGLIAVSAGAINPDTKVAYGSKTGKQNKSISLWKTLKRFMGMSKSTNFELPEAQEITKKIIDIPIEKMQAIGTQALTIMALSHFLSGKELELPQLPALKERLETATLTNEEYPQNPTIEHLRQLALTTEREALSWGVERALDLLSLDDSPLEKFEGKTIRERVEEYVAKHRDQWSQLSPEGQKEALIELHRVVGGGSISSDYAFDKYKIPYHEESKTLLHLQTLGKAQCVVFSILAWQVLNRTNTPHRVASVPRHVFLEVGSSNTQNNQDLLFYDGYSQEHYCTEKYTEELEGLTLSDATGLVYALLLNFNLRYSKAEKLLEAKQILLELK